MTDHLQQHKERLDTFTRLTGLVLSSAMPMKQSAYRGYPTGFDHTKVFWHRPSRVHVVLTEPYDGIETGRNLNNVVAGCVKEGWVWVICEYGRGIWNPPRTRAVLAGPPRAMELLTQLAQQLPFSALEKND